MDATVVVIRVVEAAVVDAAVVGAAVVLSRVVVEVATVVVRVVEALVAAVVAGAQRRTKSLQQSLYLWQSKSQWHSVLASYTPQTCEAQLLAEAVVVVAGLVVAAVVVRVVLAEEVAAAVVVRVVLAVEVGATVVVGLGVVGAAVEDEQTLL